MAKVIKKQYIIRIKQRVIVEAVDEQCAKLRGAQYFRNRFFIEEDIEIDQELT